MTDFSALIAIRALLLGYMLPIDNLYIKLEGRSIHSKRVLNSVMK